MTDAWVWTAPLDLYVAPEDRVWSVRKNTTTAPVVLIVGPCPSFEVRVTLAQLGTRTRP